MGNMKRKSCDESAERHSNQAIRKRKFETTASQQKKKNTKTNVENRITTGHIHEKLNDRKHNIASYMLHFEDIV